MSVLSRSSNHPLRVSQQRQQIITVNPTFEMMKEEANLFSPVNKS